MSKILLITVMAIVAALCACTGGSESSSNSIPKRESLPSPEPPRNGVDANGNATVNSNSSAASQNDALRNNFWTTAAQGGMAEVELGKIASEKATNVEVKNFAKMMVTDHSKANAELKALAAKKNIALPATLDQGNQSTLTELQKLNGADFDREYVEAMVDDHEADVQMFESQSADDSDPDAKTFAAKTLPTLKKHLEMIKAIQAKMK